MSFTLLLSFLPPPPFPLPFTLSFPHLCDSLASAASEHWPRPDPWSLPSLWVPRITTWDVANRLEHYTNTTISRLFHQPVSVSGHPQWAGQQGVRSPKRMSGLPLGLHQLPPPPFVARLYGPKLYTCSKNDVPGGISIVLLPTILDRCPKKSVGSGCMDFCHASRLATL